MSSRRAVPDAARRSLWLTAAWTGVGAAIACATLAVVAVAICWLPVSGASGHPMSALRAGLLTYLAGLHGGITVDGTAAQFVPLGLTIVVGYAAWRAGAALGDAADVLDESDPLRLVQAAAVQATSFAAVSALAIPFAHLGTSHASVLGVAPAALLLFAVTGGVSFARSSALAEWCAVRASAPIVNGMRAAGAALGVLIAAGALLVAGSLVLHAGRVETLSRQVGGGWSGVPILLLGLLAVPNAVIAAITYLAGPGFALGSGTHVAPIGSAHGLLPAFPVLGAVPDGHSATAPVWALIVLAPLAAGAVMARLCRRAHSWRGRFVELAAASITACVAMAVLAWQAGGGIGSGRLAVVGPSPWLAGLVVSAELAVTTAGWLGLLAARDAVRGRRPQRVLAVATDDVADDLPDDEDADVAGAPSDDGFSTPRLVVVNRTDADDSDEAGKLAG